MKNSKAIWLLLIANSISGVAQGISMLAIPWYFAGIVHQQTLFGFIYFTVTAISMVWGIYAGTLIDRYSRKKIFLAINLVGLAVLTSVAILGYAHGGLPWPAVALVFGVTALIFNIHYPNLYAFAHEITPRNNYGRVTSLLEVQGQITFTVAGGMAAILLNGVNHHLNLLGKIVQLPFVIHPWKIYEIFTLDASTYLIAFIIIWRIKSVAVVEKHTDTAILFERLKTGFRFLKHHPAVFYFGTFSLLVFLSIIVCNIYILPGYVHTYLNCGGDVYGFADMVFSAGALTAGLLSARVFRNTGVVQVCIILSAIAGMAYAVLVFNHLLLVFFALQFVIGLCNAAIRIQRITYLFNHTPNNVLGRTNSIFFMMNVFNRLCLIGIFAIPFFHHGKQIAFAMGVFSAVCFLGVVGLSVNYSKLQRQPLKTG